MANTNYYVDGDAGNDANAGTSAGAAKLTIQAGLTLCTANGDICNLLRRASNATYDITAGLTTPSGPSYGSIQRLRGYGSTIGDGTPALIKATAGSFTMFTGGDRGWLLQDLELDGNLQTSIRGATFGFDGGTVNCIVKNCTNSALTGVYAATNSWFRGCTTQPCLIGNNLRLMGVAVTGNTAGGLYWSGSTGSVNRSLFIGNTGATTDGIQSYYGQAYYNNVFYANGRHGLNIVFYPGSDGPIRNNVFVLNGGYGLICASNSHGSVSVPTYDYNSFGQGTQANTSGARSNMTAGANDVMLTSNVSPFVDAANWASKTTLADLFACFALNNTTGGGASLRAAAGMQGLDIGAVQTILPTPAQLASAMWAYGHRQLS